MPTIRAATAADLPAIGRTLAAAFDGDPTWSWMTSPRVRWSDRAPGWFEAEARAMLRGTSEVLVDDQVRGAAIWAPPKQWKSTGREALALAVPSLRLMGRNIVRGIRSVNDLEDHHPKDPPHWYLALLGTDPAHQGSGVGSALISHITDRCDQEGLPAYLESSKEQNVPFYERHGFVVREVLHAGGGPPLWTMWREPRG